MNTSREQVALEVAMDVIGYTPREFAQIEKHSAIMAQAKKKGKWIYRGRNSREIKHSVDHKKR